MRLPDWQQNELEAISKRNQLVIRSNMTMESISNWKQYDNGIKKKFKVNRRTPMTPKDDETGSISPLIIFYFSILMILIFLISNVASAYIARRELTNRVEAGLANAAQELDEFRYYYGSPLTDYLAEDSIRDGTLRVPIDCSEARFTFLKFMLYGSNPSELEVQFKCDGFEIGADVTEVHQLPFQFRALGINEFKNRVSAATSSYLLNR